MLTGVVNSLPGGHVFYAVLTALVWRTRRFFDSREEKANNVEFATRVAERNKFKRLCSLLAVQRHRKATVAYPEQERPLLTSQLSLGATPTDDKIGSIAPIRQPPTKDRKVSMESLILARGQRNMTMFISIRLRAVSGPGRVKTPQRLTCKGELESVML